MVNHHHHRHDHHHILRWTATTVACCLTLFVIYNNNNDPGNDNYNSGFVTVSAFENFPMSTRQALTQKAKELNPTTSSSQASGSFAYTTSSWSNRAATVLTPICLNPGVYTSDRPFFWNSIDVGCRMTVIELPSSKKNNKQPDLWVHSPVGLDGPLLDAMAKLGTVKYVISPNYEHVKFAPAWHQAYPNADMCM
jgi:hypothetical protein